MISQKINFEYYKLEGTVDERSRVVLLGWEKTGEVSFSYNPLEVPKLPSELEFLANNYLVRIVAYANLEQPFTMTRYQYAIINCTNRYCSPLDALEQLIADLPVKIKMYTDPTISTFGIYGITYNLEKECAEYPMIVAKGKE